MVVKLENYEDWSQLLAYIAAGIALLANSLLIFFYLYIPEVRTFFVKLLFYLSICDWFTAASMFFMGHYNSIVCHVQAGFMQFFPSASFFWMASVAITMYMQVAKHKHYMWKYELLYHIIVWPFPIISTIFL